MLINVVWTMALVYAFLHSQHYDIQCGWMTADSAWINDISNHVVVWSGFMQSWKTWKSHGIWMTDFQAWRSHGNLQKMTKVMEKWKCTFKKWHSGPTKYVILLVIFWCTCDGRVRVLKVGTKRSWNFLILSWKSPRILRFRKSNNPFWCMHT